MYPERDELFGSCIVVTSITTLAMESSLLMSNSSYFISNSSVVDGLKQN